MLNGLEININKSQVCIICLNTTTFVIGFVEETPNIIGFVQKYVSSWSTCLGAVPRIK